LSGTGTSLQEQCEKNGGYWTSDNVCHDRIPLSSTQTSTTTTVSMVPVIASVVLEKVDAQGKLAEDTRRFVIEFNGPAIDIRLKVSETVTGAVLVDSPIVANGTKGEQLRVNMDRKLKSDTAYTYEVSARSPDSAFVHALTDTFKTAYCFIGETRHCYNGIPASTEGVGKCHGGTNACIMTGNGPQWDPSCAENTPYIHGDIVGNGIDDDCDGVVDEDDAYFCPVNDSTISQGCCVPNGTAFSRPGLSNIMSLPATHPEARFLIKGSNAFVYYYAPDGKRYVFTNKDVITSWFTNFDGGQLGDLKNVCNTVNELSDVELASISIAGNVTIRPGSYILTPSVGSEMSKFETWYFVVSRGKVLHRVLDTSILVKLYSETWRSRVVTLPDAFFPNYTIGPDLVSASDYNPAAEWTGADMATEVAAKK
jgi:hypothetical protein